MNGLNAIDARTSCTAVAGWKRANRAFGAVHRACDALTGDQRCRPPVLNFFTLLRLWSRFLLWVSFGYLRLGTDNALVGAVPSSDDSLLGTVEN
jgi:hypothetical protein